MLGRRPVRSPGSGIELLLGEILLDNRTTEEKVKGAARSAPFWVIAVMAHVILAFVLGMIVLRHEMAKEPAENIIGELRSGKEFSQGELLGLQAEVHMLSEQVQMSTKLVDSAMQSIKSVMQQQV